MAQQNVETSEQASSGAVIAAGLSILYSWYLFFLKQDRQRGIFVGLWAPTIIGLASYLEQTDMVEKMQEEA
jgi:hypothetical protein